MQYNKRYHIWFIALLTLFQVSATSALSQSSASANADDLLKGVNYMTGNNNMSLYNSANVDGDLALLQGDGVRWARIELPIMSDPNQITSCLSSMEQHKVAPLLDLLCARYSASDTTARAKYKAWLANTMKMLKDKVQVYEIGNEENLSKNEEGWGPYVVGCEIKI